MSFASNGIAGKVAIAANTIATFRLREAPKAAPTDSREIAIETVREGELDYSVSYTMSCQRHSFRERERERHRERQPTRETESKKKGEEQERETGRERLGL